MESYYSQFAADEESQHDMVENMDNGRDDRNMNYFYTRSQGKKHNIPKPYSKSNYNGYSNSNYGKTEYVETLNREDTNYTESESFCGGSAELEGKVLFQPIIFKDEQGESSIYNKYNKDTKRTKLTVPLRFAYYQPPVVNPAGYRIYYMDSWRIVVPRNFCKEQVQEIYKCIKLRGPAACGYTRYYDTLVPSQLSAISSQMLSTI